MASDFTIVMWVRHRFGDPDQSLTAEADPDWNAPFVGLAGEFEFSCPEIDTSQGTIIQFEQRRVSQSTDFPDPRAPNLIGVSPEFPVKINMAECWRGESR
jgi:hypothetical protein